MLKAIQIAKSLGAATLLLLGFICLGRALETSLDQNPDRLHKRETITAGILLGLPTAVGGTWLALNSRRHHQTAEANRLRAIFFELVNAGEGQLTVLQFAMAAQMDGDKAKAYLSDRSQEYDGTFQVDDEGTILYCFALGHTHDRASYPTLQ